MNPQFRKVALIAAGLGLLVSLYFALSPGGDDETASDDATAAQTTTAATTTEPEATTTAATTTAPAEPQVVRISVSVPGDKAPTVKHFTIKQGSQVVFVVKSELADEVHLHGYDLSADVAPGEPATIRFKATAPGLFEAELESRSLPIARARGSPLTLLAHGIGGVRDLPVPDWLFFWGGGGRARPLVPRARGALEDPAARAAARWASVAGRARAVPALAASCTGSSARSRPACSSSSS